MQPLFMLLSLLLTALAAPRQDIRRNKTVPGPIQRVHNAELTIMTFNIWLSGAEVTDGMEKIAKHIMANNPDVVALQEVWTTEVMANLTALLGPEWTGLCKDQKYPDVGIVTRHTIVNDSRSDIEAGIGAHIHMKEKNMTIAFWSLHLEPRSYGPYAAFNKLVTDKSQIFAGELNTGFDWAGRVQGMQELLINEDFNLSIKKSDKIPLFVCGDFNAPSHLDWINETRHLHGDWTFHWPVTKLLQHNAGIIDSYREVYHDPLENPGNTWSTVQKFSGQEWGYSIPEPQDRIDFIFYRSTQLAVKDSRTYSGTMHLNPIPYHKGNDYPSDHYAVISDFYFMQ